MVRSVFFNQGSTELHGSTGDCRGFHRNRPKFETTVLYAVAAIDISIIAWGSISNAAERLNITAAAERLNNTGLS